MPGECRSSPNPRMRLQLPHARRRVPAVSGQPVHEAPTSAAPIARRADGVLEQLAVARERALAATSTIQPACGCARPARTRARCRARPEPARARPSVDAGREERQTEPRCGRSARAPWRRRQRCHAAEERSALRPRQEAFDLRRDVRVAEARPWAARCSRHSIEWRKRRHRLLPLLDLVARRPGVSSHSGEPARAHRRRRRARATERATRARRDPDRPRMDGPSTTTGRPCGGSPGGRLAQSRRIRAIARSLTRLQRVQPRRCDPRLARARRRAPRRSRRRPPRQRGVAPAGRASRPRPRRLRREESQKTQARENARSAGLRQPLGSIAPQRRLRNAAARPALAGVDGASGHAACSAASGFRAAIFNLQ